MVVLFFFVAISAIDALSLELGERLPKSAVKGDELLMVNSAQLEPVYLVSEKGQQFKVCWRVETGITYIEPQGKAFGTPEGVKQGMTFKKVRALAKQEPQKQPGYLFFVRLPSGWYAGFVQGRGLTDGELKDDTKVIVIFKSTWL